MATGKGSRTPSGFWLGFFQVIASVVDRFGWPGALLIFGFYFVERHATSQQKVEIIDLYVLGKGIRVEYPLIIFAVVAILVFFAQRTYYRKRIKLQQAELDRLGQWKTDHQEKKIGNKLHHTGVSQD